MSSAQVGVGGEGAWPTVSRRAEGARQIWLAPSIALVALGLSALYAPAPSRAELLPMIWRLPTGINAVERPLDAEALTWLRRDGADSANRWSFSYGGLAGQLLLVSSEDWRAQHLPERCLEVQGLSLDGSRAHLVADDFALRLVAIGGPRGAPGDGRTAAYWFQSPTKVTDDWATRLWDSLAGSREQWVLVTVLFDDAVDPRSADAVSFFSSLRNGIASSLSGSSPHVESAQRSDCQAFDLPSNVLLAASPLVKSGPAENRLEQPVLSRPEPTATHTLADSAPLSAPPNRVLSGR